MSLKLSNHSSERINSQLLVYVLLSIVIFTNVVITDYIRTDFPNMVWSADDATYIAGAGSFYKSQSLSSGYTQSETVSSKFIDDLIIEFNQISNPQGGKGPLYFISLGSFYTILNTNPSDLWLHASYFGTLLTSIFLVLFFYFVKKKFDLSTAFISSFVVCFIPYFALLGSKVHPTSLVIILTFLTLFFLRKKYFHYFMLGLLSGLVWLTHPWGLFLGLTCSIYLLIHKRFSGFIILNLIGFGVLSPLFVWNYYNFGDIGWGLFIPFSDRISEFLTFLPRVSDVTRVSLPTELIVSRLETIYPIFSVIKYVLYEFEIIYKMNLFIFTMFLSGFAFFKFDELKKHIYLIIPFISVLIFGYFIVFTSQNIILELIFAFVLPVIFIFFLYKRHNLFFDFKNSNESFFIALFLFISILGIYLTSILLGRVDPESRQLVIPIIMFVPFLIYGLKKFFILLVSRIKTKQKNVLVFLLIGLILIPSLLQMTQGLEEQKSYPVRTGSLETPELKQLHQFINKNFDIDSSLASNEPAYTFLNTQRYTIGLPMILTTQEDFDRFVSHYDISYLINYDNDVASISNVDLLFEEITTNQPNDYFYEKIYDDGNSQIYESHNLLNAKISHPIAYFWKAIKLETESNQLDANTLFDEIKKLELYDTLRTYPYFCNSIFMTDKVDVAVVFCMDEIMNPSTVNAHFMDNAIIYFETINDKDSALKIFKNYDNFVLQNYFDVKIAETWDHVIQKLIKFDKFYHTLIVDKLNEAQKLKNDGETQKALSIYRQLGLLLKTDLPIAHNANLERIDLVTEIDLRNDQTINTKSEISMILKIYENTIEKSIHDKEYDNANQLQKLQIDILTQRAKLFESQNDLNSAIYVYSQILGDYDRFNSMAFLNLGNLYVLQGEIQSARISYERALQFSIDDVEKTMILDKIKHLEEYTNPSSLGE